MWFFEHIHMRAVTPCNKGVEMKIMKITKCVEFIAFKFTRFNEITSLSISGHWCGHLFIASVHRLAWIIDYFVSFRPLIYAQRIYIYVYHSCVNWLTSDRTTCTSSGVHLGWVSYKQYTARLIKINTMRIRLFVRCFKLHVHCLFRSIPFKADEPSFFYRCTDIKFFRSQCWIKSQMRKKLIHDITS